jgi:predicted ferric reductase
LIEKQEGRLNLKQLAAAVPDWKRADIWFCDPLSLAGRLEPSMMEQGLKARQFHQELFEMR